MQLQGQTPAIRVKVYPPGTFLDEDVKRGDWGDPVLYRHDDSAKFLHTHWIKRGHPIGTILVGKKPSNQIDYYYVIREYKDGWWKLEWPD